MATDRNMRHDLILSITIAIFLILSGNPVSAADNELTQREEEEGWMLLFDGRSLNGWKNTAWLQRPAAPNHRLKERRKNH